MSVSYWRHCFEVHNKQSNNTMTMHNMLVMESRREARPSILWPVKLLNCNKFPKLFFTYLFQHSQDSATNKNREFYAFFNAFFSCLLHECSIQHYSLYTLCVIAFRSWLPIACMLVCGAIFIFMLGFCYIFIEASS